jgi:hypothetical protein
MSRIRTEARRELVASIQERYRSASLLDKQRILDELVARTGYHRKYAIRALGSSSPVGAERRGTPPRERIYGEAVGEALAMLWEAADRICGKRLKPLLPTLVAALEHHGHLTLDPVVRERVLTASAATIDRLLATRRATAGERRPIRRSQRAGPRPPRHWRTRKDPFEAVWPRVVAWLESEPDATAKRLLQRLQSGAPDSFPDGLLRTLQRRVKEWRHLAARHAVRTSAGSATPETLE